MSKSTDISVRVNGRNRFDQLPSHPKNTLRISIYPADQAITHNYWDGGKALLFQAAQPDPLEPVLNQVKEAPTQPAASADDMLCAAATRSYRPRISDGVAPPDVLLALLSWVNGAVK